VPWAVNLFHPPTSGSEHVDSQEEDEKAQYYSGAVGGPRGAGVLIGRQAELAVLDELIAHTAAGAGGVVLLTGDPGVGKTRLAREAAQRAAGAMVSWGACRESEGAPPLWPWRQVLRRLDGPAVTADAAEGPAARFRLYEQIERTLREAAATTPHLLVIDDLHRADEASLRLLGYLGDALWPSPIGMILTYRDTEVPAAAPAADVIAGLARRPGGRRCELAGLSRRSVAEWLHAAGVGGIDADDLHARTGGNPLFIAESIQLFTDGARSGTPLRSVREVIRERLAPLPPACRDALEVASVLGRDFEYPPLAAALHASPDRAVATLDAAVNARLVCPDDSRGGAEPARVRGAGPAGVGPGQCRDRGGARGQRAHRRAPCRQHLRQDRRQEPGRGDGLGPSPRAGRLTARAAPG
jgi:predicted ATPase